MDWLRELLKQAGWEDAKIDAFIGDVNKELPKHFVPKSQYNELSETRKKLEKDVADRDKQIDDLGKTAGLSEDLKQQIETLKTENQTAKTQYESDLKEVKISNAITAALSGKVHNEKVVTGLIDKTKLVLGDDGKIVGLDEQLTGLKTSDAYLFKPEEAQGQQQQQQPGIKVGAGKTEPPAGGQLSLGDAIAAHFTK
ncbi:MULTISPECIES: phage scaffolding protein [unclassified Paenibacillus]|uniref:phage scaffolding protein n=1 Tax=unclassified Paenibacillus TaxID=185978 RepID=UPI0004146D30|nr:MULTISPECIES: phage scaffolding protein [unclassified Paenibacillus]KGP80090.1 minor structural GP20 protein [Paenibacillus sp. MAEPY2]KGP89409.1 minor structural GP20 protein [Paenibacillus sp. MAEPY1]